MVDDANWRGGPSADWFVNWDKALAEAKKTGKALFLLNTGSDWCGWCKKLRAEVLDKPEFAELARKNLVLVYLDSPNRPPLGKEQKAHNQRIVKALPFGGGVPHVLVMNAKGEKLGAIGGGGLGLDEYLEKLRGILADKGSKVDGKDAQVLFGGGYGKMVEEIAARRAALPPVATNDFKAVLTGMAVVDKDRRYGKKDDIEFLPPDAKLEVPYGKTALFRVEYDFPEGYEARVWTRDGKCDDGKSHSWHFGSNPSRMYKGKGTAYGFLSLLDRGKTCRVKELLLNTNTDPELDDYPHGWTIATVPVDVEFKEKLEGADAEGQGDAVNRPTVSKYVPKDWTEDFEAARRQAAKEGKFVLVAFSGSDWCGPCKALEQEVFSQKKFVDEASKKFVLTMVSVPRDKTTLSKLALAQNDGLKNRYAIRGFPTVVIVDPVDGKEVKRHSGYRDGSVRDYLTRLEKLLDGTNWPQPGVIVRKLAEVQGKQGEEDSSALARLRQKRMAKAKEHDKNPRLSMLEQTLSAEKAMACAKGGDARGFYQLAILYAKKASQYDSSDADRAKSLATSDKCLAKAVEMGYGNALLLRAIDIAHRKKYCGRHRHANDWYRCAGMDLCGTEDTSLDKSTMLIDAFTNRTVVAEVVAAFDQAARAGVTNAVFFTSYITNDLASSAAFKLRKRAEEAHETARIDAAVDGLLNGRAGIKPAGAGERGGASAKETGTGRAPSSPVQTRPENSKSDVTQLERQFPFDEAVRMASKGNGSGLYSLALHYAAGLEVAQNGKRAAKYLEKAIEAKNGNAALVKALVMEDNLKEGGNRPRGIFLNSRMPGTADETPHSRIRKYTGHGFFVFTIPFPSEHGEGLHVTNDTAVAIVRSAYKKAVDLGCSSAKEEEERFERHVKRMREQIREEEAEKQAWIDKVNANARLAQEFLGESPEANPVYDKARHSAKRDRDFTRDDAGIELKDQRETLLQIQEALRKRRQERENLRKSGDAK